MSVGESRPLAFRRAQAGLRMGFAFLILLLLFSVFRAYQIQETLSAEAVQIYHSHVEQDEALYLLRRTIWTASVAARDYLLDPTPARAAEYLKNLQALRHRADKHVADLKSTSPIPIGNLSVKTSEFWSILDELPSRSAGLSPSQRFDLAQAEITTRREGIGEMVREFTAVSRRSLQESEKRFAENRRGASRQLQFLLLISALAGVFVAWFTLRYARRLEAERKRQYDDVLKAKAELEQLSARLMALQEEERANLSRELHDEVGQMLATLRLEISRTETLAGDRTPEMRERLQRARALAEQTIRTIRNISLLLRPSLLDDLGLGPALHWQCEEFTRRTGVTCTFTEAGADDALPDEIRTCVYRVVQESLHNCEKYANATEVRVDVAREDSDLVLNVADNGCGFDCLVTPSRPALGLLGIRERSAALGGSLKVNSAPGRGTHLMLRLPVPEFIRLQL